MANRRALLNFKSYITPRWSVGILLLSILCACGPSASMSEQPEPQTVQTVEENQATSDSSETNTAETSIAETPLEEVQVAVVKAVPAKVSIDPAPPEVHKLETVPVPKAKKYDRVKFHAALKPLPKGAVTHDWKNFLGPTHNGVSTETKLQKKWPKSGPKLVWELETGISYSSPSIQGEYLVYPHRVGNEVIVECLHPATGEKYWEFRFETVYRDRYGYGSGPRASPLIDGDRVYLYSAEGKLFCLKLQTGQLYWKRNLNKEFNVVQDFFGTVSSPLLEQGKLIINVGSPNGPCVIALDKLTGAVVWAVNSENNWGPSYASPTPATVHGKRRVFIFAGGDSDPAIGGLMSLDPANGKIDFEFPWRSKTYESVNASCPVVIGDQVFVSATYKQGSALVKVNPNFKAEVSWTTKDVGIHWNTAVHKDGYLYAFDGRNEPDASLVCMDLKTGKVVWREEPEWEEVVEIEGQKQPITLSTLRGSLLKVDGKFLALGEFGHLLWLDLSPEGYKEISRSWLFAAQQSWALPVLSHGLLYVSQNTPNMLTRKSPTLYCYDLRGGGENEK